jgi:hypothetical protein
LEKVSKDTDRDFILTAEQAKDYGVVDEVISSRALPHLSGFEPSRPQGANGAGTEAKSDPGSSSG